MIQYTLKCDQGHSFDSWFKSFDAFDKLASAGHLTCSVCGSADVGKAVMSPRVASARKAPATPGAKGTPDPVPAKRTPQPVATTHNAEMQRAFAELRRRVESQSDYVGDRFAREARAMHLGDAPERSIYGEATADDAKSLAEDGVPVMPLPFMPTRKTN